jgi:hypothetical protein
MNMRDRTLKQFGMALLCMLMLSAHGGTTLSNEDSKREGWTVFSDPQLGIAFEHPVRWHVWRIGQDVFLHDKPKPSNVKKPSSGQGKAKMPYRQVPQVDLALNGRFLSEQDYYTLRLTVGQGTFSSANAKHQVFEFGDDKKPRVAFGRFNNEPARQRDWGMWRGLDSTIICSSSDEETGFHAAGGWCYWALISDQRQYVLIESQHLVDEHIEKLILRIASSIKSVMVAH